MHLLLSLCPFPWYCALPADAVVWLLSVFAGRIMLIVGVSSSLVLGVGGYFYRHSTTSITSLLVGPQV